MLRLQSIMFVSFGLVLLATTAGCPPAVEGEGEGEGEGEDCSIGVVDVDRTVSPDECAFYTASENLIVRDGATLTLAAGTDVRFSRSFGFVVDGGRVVANGTADDPIVLRSIDADADPGSWIGLTVLPSAVSTTLSFVRIQDGGQLITTNRGCLTNDALTTSVTDSVFANCSQSGAHADQPFAAFAGNAIVDSDVGLNLVPDAVASIEDVVTVENVLHHAVHGSDEFTTTATWITQPLPWVFERSLVIANADNSPVLTLQSGAVLQFARGFGIDVGSGRPGGLVAVGTEEAPITLQSSDPAAAAGAWSGVAFFVTTLPASTLSHVNILDAGQPVTGHDGCLTLGNTTAGTVSVTDCTFTRCAQAGVAVNGDNASFGAFARNAITDSDSGLFMNANTIGSIEDVVTMTNVPFNSIDTTNVNTDATWVAQTIPWRVRDNLNVPGTVSAASLTIQGGTFLFNRSFAFRVGIVGPGALQATGTTFASQDPMAVAGSWAGLSLAANVTSVTLTNVSVQQAGQGVTGIHAGITLDRTEGTVTIDNPTFANNAQADVFVDCDSTPTLTNMGAAVVVNEPGCAP